MFESYVVSVRTETWITSTFALRSVTVYDANMFLARSLIYITTYPIIHVLYKRTVLPLKGVIGKSYIQGFTNPIL